MALAVFCVVQALSPLLIDCYRPMLYLRVPSCLQGNTVGRGSVCCCTGFVHEAMSSACILTEILPFFYSAMDMCSE